MTLKVLLKRAEKLQRLLKLDNNNDRLTYVPFCPHRDITWA
jgi:hypothetical protein